MGGRRAFSLAVLLLLAACRQTSAESAEAEALAESGDKRYEKGDVDGALADYTKAIELDSKYVPAYCGRAIARRAKGDLDGAVADDTKAIDVDPTYPLPYINRGNARRDKGDLDGSIADYTKAIDLDPEFAYAYANRGAARWEMGDLDRAISDLDKAIDLDPKFLFAYTNRGIVRRDKGDMEGAIADFDKVIDLSPQNGPAYRSRATALYLSGDAKASIADFSKAVELGKSTPRDYAAISRWMAQVTAEKDHAVPDLTTYFGKRSWKEGDEWTASIIALALGKLSTKEILERAAKSTEADRPGRICEAAFYSGIAALSRDDGAEAAEDFQKALATGKKSFKEYRLAQFELERLKKNR